jgi:uncharacterized protein
MKKVFIVLIVCLTGLQLFSQTKQEKINKLISIINSEEMTDKMFGNMLQIMKQQSSKDLTQEQQDELSAFIISEFKTMIHKAVNESFPKIYDKYLTENDIDGLTEFYQSPVGQKYLKVAPDIQMELMRSFMNTDMAAFQKKVDEKRKEIKERK